MPFILQIIFVAPINVETGKPQTIDKKPIAQCPTVPHEYREFLHIQRPEVQAIIRNFPKSCRCVTLEEFEHYADLSFHSLIETPFFKHYKFHEDKYFYWNEERHARFEEAILWFLSHGHYMVKWTL
jgi:hypothetical protein